MDEETNWGIENSQKGEYVSAAACSVNFMVAARTITVWAEIIRWLLTHFVLKLKTPTHRLQYTFTVAADEQLVLPSAGFVFMRSVIHAVYRKLTQHR
ncbi:MAG: hypothetical protein RQ722_01875 [Desulfuromonadales bacterium]|nr:hypothetical protein [Desulfuromonadales bacterium]